VTEPVSSIPLTVPSMRATLPDMSAETAQACIERLRSVAESAKRAGDMDSYATVVEMIDELTDHARTVHECEAVIEPEPDEPVTQEPTKEAIPATKKRGRPRKHPLPSE
jgi:hypothetical protein